MCIIIGVCLKMYCVVFTAEPTQPDRLCAAPKSVLNTSPASGPFPKH